MGIWIERDVILGNALIVAIGCSQLLTTRRELAALAQVLLYCLRSAAT